MNGLNHTRSADELELRPLLDSAKQAGIPLLEPCRQLTSISSTAIPSTYCLETRKAGYNCHSCAVQLLLLSPVLFTFSPECCGPELFEDRGTNHATSSLVSSLRPPLCKVSYLTDKG